MYNTIIDQLTYTGLTLQNYLLSPFTNFAASCKPKADFFGFPTWYKYLDGQGTGMNCVPKLSGLNDIWLIVLAIIEILLRVAAIAAVVFVLIGGIKYIASRGNSDKLATAKNTVLDALIGLVIAVIAIVAVNFVGRSIS